MGSTTDLFSFYSPAKIHNCFSTAKTPKCKTDKWDMSSYRESEAGYLGTDMGNINIYAHTRFCTCCSLAQHPNHVSVLSCKSGGCTFSFKSHHVLQMLMPCPLSPLNEDKTWDWHRSIEYSPQQCPLHCSPSLRYNSRPRAYWSTQESIKA